MRPWEVDALPGLGMVAEEEDGGKGRVGKEGDGRPPPPLLERQRFHRQRIQGVHIWIVLGWAESIGV